MKCAVKQRMNDQHTRSLDNFINIGIDSCSIQMMKQFGFGSIRLRRVLDRIRKNLDDDFSMSKEKNYKGVGVDFEDVDAGLYITHREFDKQIGFEDMKFGTEFDAYMNVGVKLFTLALKGEFTFGHDRMQKLYSAVFDEIQSILSGYKAIKAYSEFDVLSMTSAKLRNNLIQQKKGLKKNGK